jgi:hypothetical protein
MDDYYYKFQNGHASQDHISAVRQVRSHAELVQLMATRTKQILTESGGKPFYEPSTFYYTFKEAHYHDDYVWAARRLADPISINLGDYWGDFERSLYGNYHQFTPTAMSFLPEDARETAALIVTALNKLKNLTWAYALCVKNMPNYDDHPLRAKILAEMASVGVDAAKYDETAALMRDIVQDFYGAIQRHNAKKA